MPLCSRVRLCWDLQCVFSISLYFFGFGISCMHLPKTEASIYASMFHGEGRLYSIFYIPFM